MSVQKIQDGVRIKISFQKSIERKVFAVLLASSSFAKIEVQEFPNLEKTQHFQNSLKIRVFF
jgi:hexokinase